jgi:tetratricopeptide (TPR) repeat protein
MVGNQFNARYSQGRPLWMREGTLKVALLDGYEDLEVVGESYRQENLWRLLGGQHRPEVHVRMDVYAMLVAEDGNPYDANAVSVWINGLMVGYLPRGEARKLRPGLLALQEREGKPIVLEGVIVGGGMRDDGPGRLGVFLRYDSEDFGLSLAPQAPYADARLRAALGDDLACGNDSPYNLVWMHGLSEDDAHAVKVLRKALATESNAIGRHFIYAELEAALYRCRAVFTSALDDYDEVCKQHDSEMDSIRSACMAHWGKIPVLDTYRQMAIRQQKRHDYGQALRWAERGLALYGDDAARPEAIDDLRKRAVSYRTKIGPKKLVAPSPGRPMAGRNEPTG